MPCEDLSCYYPPQWPPRELGVRVGGGMMRDECKCVFFYKHLDFVPSLFLGELEIIRCFIAMSSKVGGKIREGGGVSFRSGPICFGHGCNNS